MTKRIIFLVLTVLSVLQLTAQQGRIHAVNGNLIGVTRRVKDFKKDPSRFDIPVRDQKGLFWNRGKRKNPVIRKDPTARYLPFDPLRKKSAAAALSPEIEVNREGMSDGELSPADPTLCVGTNHVIQMVNGPSGAYFQVFNKAGEPLTERTYLDNLVENSAYSGAGDGICLYDQFADRYIMMEFGAPEGISDINTLVFFVSTTNDPLQDWYIYKFTDNSFFPDYPKISVWNEQAYFATSRDFSLPDNNFAGVSFFAFNRQQMLSGSSDVQLQRVRMTDAEKYDGAAPVNVFGSELPPAGTPGLFVFRNDDARTSAADTDSIGLMAFDVNFLNPSASRFYPAGSVPTAPFNSEICSDGGYFQACATVPANNAKLMATTAFIMDKPVYRRFAGHESILAYHTVNAADPGVAGIRWHELRRTTGNWQLYQEGTYSPDSIHRYYPSMNMNSKGQIALVYNASSADLWPSIRVVGRNANDPSGTLPADETSVVTGTGYGTFSSRWGDYNMIAPDPQNDSIFWLTSMYGNSLGWRTKIASVKLAANKQLDAKMGSILSPLNGQVYCGNTGIVTRIRIGNSGEQAIESLRINWQVNNGAPGFIDWTGTLAFGADTTLELPISFTGDGNYSVRVYLSLPNGGADERTANDTLVSNFSIQEPATGQVSTGFEDAIFPPPGWRVANPNLGSMTWARTTVARNTGVASAYMNLYNYEGTDDLDFLISPSIRMELVDTVTIRFAHAYKPYSIAPDFADSLLLMASTDCGNSFPLVVWRRGGTGLASTSGTTGDLNWVPMQADWQQNAIQLPGSMFGNATTVSFAWVTVNKFGQNVYLDDISITATSRRQRDIALVRIVEPRATECSPQITPVIEVRNNGRETINSLVVGLRVDNGPPVTDTLTGLQLLSGDTLRVVSSAFLSHPSGESVFTAFVSNPNGADDEVLGNDTLSRRVFLFAPVQGSIKQGFEGSEFPPQNWAVINPGNNLTWEEIITTASEGQRAARIQNFANTQPGDTDDLYLPPVTLPAGDSTYLHFDLSYIAPDPEPVGYVSDTLQIWLTTDCGRTSTLVYSKWGAVLNTVKDPNRSPAVAFEPIRQSDWRTDSINLTGLLATNQPFQLYFRNISNGRNNLYLDNIRIDTVNLPAKLKRDGYLVAPNPTSGVVNIRLYRQPENLRSLEVVNLLGQRIYSRSFNGNAPSWMTIDLSRQAMGVYIVRLIYPDHVFNTRIIKTQQ